MLWKEIKNKAYYSTISFQNITRQILGNYFKILGGISEDNIVDKFSVPEKNEICRSLMLWINDISSGRHKRKIENFKWESDNYRPHSNLNDLTPKEFVNLHIRTHENILKFGNLLLSSNYVNR